MPFVLENIFSLASIHLSLPYVYLLLGFEVRCDVGQSAFTDCTISLHSAAKAPSLANPSSRGSFRREEFMVREDLLWILYL